jgi:hypothetical protein
MPAEVVNIYGEGADPRRANADVVAMLERQLEKARAGEITAAAMAFVYFDGASGQQRAGLTGKAPKLIGELFMLMQDMGNV